MEPRTMTTTQGVTFTTTLTDEEAAQAADRIPTGHGDHGFARTLIVAYRRDNGFLSPRRLPYLHQMALEQIARETSVQTPPRANDETPTQEYRNDPMNTRADVVEAMVFTEEQKAQAAALDPHMFFYDIPVRGPDGKPTKLPNPSAQLWRVGARINLSCWVIPKGNIPYNLMGRIIEAGGSVHTIPFAKEAAETLLDLIAVSLQKETAEALERTEESMTHAIEGKGSRREREKGIEAARKRVEKLLGDLNASAQVFGLSLSALPMNRALAKARVLQQQAYAKAKTYRAAAVKLGETNSSDGQGIARAVQAGDEVPVGILNDVLIDTGDEETAENLREQFFESFQPIKWD